MGFFDIFKKRENKTVSKKENNQLFEEITIENEEFIELEEKETDVVFQKNYNYSSIISNEIIEEIKRINNLEYIDDILIKKMENHPKLVNLLLEGNISQIILNYLNYYEKIDYLRWHEEDLRFIEFFELEGQAKKLVSLLDNRINDVTNRDKYISCYINLENETETIDFHNKIESFIPDIKINLGSELLTKTSIYSPFILYFPKTKHKLVTHDFRKFITGEIEFNEDTIVQMSYDTFKYLDESIVNKISNCKIIFSEKFKFEENVQQKDELNYKLLKYNHLIYIIENSSLNDEIKEKLLYQLKNMYIDDLFYFDLEITDKIIPYLNILDIDEIKKLTEEFELNIEIYKNKSIESPEFNASFYIDEFFPNFDNASLKDIVDFIHYLPDELKLVFLKEVRVLKKLNIPNNLNDNELNKFIFLISQKLPSTTIDFINSFNFDVESFMLNPNNNYQSSLDINPIISKYGVFDYFDEERVISVADLVGHDGIVNCGGYKGKNILHTFENFFERNGDGYHTRSLSLLEYKSGEQLIRELEGRDNDTKDMKVRQIEDGKYIISGNGLHRFSVLRFHYLLDSMKKEKSEDELRELYKIPVNLVSRTNNKNTYCNYLIQKANPDIYHISFDYKEDEITIHYYSTEQMKIINEEMLIKLAVQSIEILDKDSLSEIMYYYKNYDSFHEFIDKYIPNRLNLIEQKNKEVIQR